MPYVCELSRDRTLYLDNTNGQTTVSISSTAPGQQQQTTSRFQTGNWTVPPDVYLTRDGAIIKLQAEHGSHYIRVHGSSIGVSEACSLDSLEPIPMQHAAESAATAGQPIPPPPKPGLDPLPPMTPMAPMSPMGEMNMGDMTMSMKPMTMRMGNMSLSMESPAAAPTAETSHVRRFCGQCGAPTQASDRFCTSCGQRLGE